jgi:hypothetical protein
VRCDVKLLCVANVQGLGGWIQVMNCKDCPATNAKTKRISLSVIFKGLGNETVAYFKVLFQNSPDRSRENHTGNISQV